MTISNVDHDDHGADEILIMTTQGHESDTAAGPLTLFFGASARHELWPADVSTRYYEPSCSTSD
jgi:hypothetical protein